MKKIATAIVLLIGAVSIGLGWAAYQTAAMPPRRRCPAMFRPERCSTCRRRISPRCWRTGTDRRKSRPGWAAATTRSFRVPGCSCV